MTVTGVKWKRAPKKRICDHQHIELVERDQPGNVVGQRMGHTAVHCIKGCDSVWWEPNDNLEALGYELP